MKRDQPAADSPAAGLVLDPVFVLCNGRSGSTLLRFLLDAHPQLACPPETNLPALCAQLATVWSLIEGAPLSANRGDEPPEIPDAAITGIRHMMDLMVGSYLDRRGKQRYCDKSLATARFAELLVRVYPQARFLCLYRHPMDVIASGIDACPWGLSGYGFDPYIAGTPGNAVLALARFWADNVATVLAVEERFPEHCHRVHYEDLVADPERVAAGVFGFLGVSPAPGVSVRCFSSERERFGPADFKIWTTSQITADSVGKGWSLPATIIAPPVLAQVNELATKLGYRPVDGDWGTTEPPASLRPDPAAVESDGAAAAIGAAAAEIDDAVDAGAAAVPAAAVPAAAMHSASLGDRLRSGLAAAATHASTRWSPHMAESFVAVCIPDRSGGQSEYWLVDMKSGTVTMASRRAQDKSDWDVIGSAGTWDEVLSGELNLNLALRGCRLRYCDEADAGSVAADTRISILADLLGIAGW
jgi:hypothetical protein